MAVKLQAKVNLESSMIEVKPPPAKSSLSHSFSFDVSDMLMIVCFIFSLSCD